MIALSAAPAAWSSRQPDPSVAEAVKVAAAAAKTVWTVDVNADGAADFANPTHAGLRGIDAYGSGKFGAGRDHGKRKHEGADFLAAPGTKVHSPLAGKVTEIGYAYHDDVHLRFIEISNAVSGLGARVFYVEPSVKVGQIVVADDIIGVAEALGDRYPRGITNHVHVEIRDHAGAIDPSLYVPLTGAPV